MRRPLLALLLPIAIIGCGSGAPSSAAGAGPSQAAVSTGSPAAVATSPASAPPPTPTVRPTTAPTAEPTAAPPVACHAAQLKATVKSWEGAAGHQIATLRLVNDSPGTCVIQGTPGLQLVDAHGAVLIDSATSDQPVVPHVDPGDEVFLMDHGTVIATMVQVANYCGALDATPPTTIAFLLPSGGGRLVAAPGPGGDVPGCMSDPGTPGSIDMNGWTR